MKGFTRRRGTAAAAAVLAAGLIAAGCSSGDDSSTASESTPDAPTAEWLEGADAAWDTVMADAQEEGTVVVAGPAPLADAMTEAFENDTGIELEWVGGSGSDLSSRFETEVRAGHASIDLLFGGGNELETLLPDGLLEPIKPQLILPSVQEGPNWREGTWHWYDNAGQYLFQGTTYVFGYVTVNGDLVDADAIQTWDDLLAPEYKGKIIAYDPRSNGPGQGAVGAMALALDYPYLEQLFTEQDVTFVADNDQLAQAVARGDQPIALALIQQQIEKFVAEGINLQVVLPEPMPGYLTPGFGVVRQAKGAPNPAAAQVFLNWYASKNGQQTYQDVMLESSNRLDTDKSKLPDYTVPQEGVEYLNDGLSEDYYVTDRKVVIEQVTELIGGR